MTAVVSARVHDDGDVEKDCRCTQFQFGTPPIPISSDVDGAVHLRQVAIPSKWVANGGLCTRLKEGNVRTKTMVDLQRFLIRREAVFEAAISRLFYDFRAEPALLSPNDLRHTILEWFGDDVHTAFTSYPMLINALAHILPRACQLHANLIAVDIFLPLLQPNDVFLSYRVMHQGQFLDHQTAFAYMNLPPQVAVSFNSDGNKMSVSALTRIHECRQLTGNIISCKEEQFSQPFCDILALSGCPLTVVKVTPRFLHARKYRDAFAIATTVEQYKVRNNNSEVVTTVEVPPSGVFLLRLQLKSTATFATLPNQTVIHGAANRTLLSEYPAEIRFDVPIPRLPILLAHNDNLTELLVTFDHDVQVWESHYANVDVQDTSFFNGTAQFILNMDVRLQSVLLGFLAVFVALMLACCIANASCKCRSA